MVRSSIILLLIISFGAACRQRPVNQVNPRIGDEMPTTIIWAWERPEDLRFIDTDQVGVAFLAQTLYLEKANVEPDRRKQPLDVPDGTYLIAVIRIETQRDTFRRPTFDESMVSEVARLIRGTLDLPNVKAIQIDFDAMASERSFYRAMMYSLKRQLPAETPLTMTALASWCTGDAWFNDFPVDEAVPMVFQMGADSEKIRNYIRNGRDWNEPMCRGSYGLAIEEGRPDGTKNGRRTYYFKNSAWRPEDIVKLP